MRIGGGEEERIPDLGGDRQAILVDGGDAGDVLNGGRGKAVGRDEGGDEGGVLVPEAEAVTKDVEALAGVEGEVLVGERRGGWRRRGTEGLVELAGRGGGKGGGDFGEGDDGGFRGVTAAAVVVVVVEEEGGFVEGGEREDGHCWEEEGKMINILGYLIIVCFCMGFGWLLYGLDRPLEGWRQTVGSGQGVRVIN